MENIDSDDDDAYSKNEDDDYVAELTRPSYMGLKSNSFSPKEQERGSTIAKFTKDVFVSEVQIMRFLRSDGVVLYVLGKTKYLCSNMDTRSSADGTVNFTITKRYSEIL